MVHHDPGSAWPGVNLYTSLPDASAVLLGMDGEVLNVWRDRVEEGARWTDVELLEDGDLLCISPKENHLIRMSWGGEERWRLSLDAHHDVRLTDHGEILVLTRSLRSLPEIHAERMSVENTLTWLTPAGEVLRELPLYDLLARAPGITMKAPEHIHLMPADINVDPIHCNTAVPIGPGMPAPFAEGAVLLTLRYPCALVLVDPEAEEVLWTFGPGVLEGPHDAQLLENGHVLVLDNGWEERGWSRVLELDPRTSTIVWEYTAPNPRDFFTAGRGTVQKLPNGNVLVGNSNSGEAFEVTPEGEIVWRFLNPSRSQDGRRATLRIERMAVDEIEAILARVEGE